VGSPLAHVMRMYNSPGSLSAGTSHTCFEFARGTKVLAVSEGGSLAEVAVTEITYDLPWPVFRTSTLSTVFLRIS
jgi:hypothetical protein